jgi:hypothetical protein
MTCEECESIDVTTSLDDMKNEFNKLLCDDCYTDYRRTIQHIFGLKDLFDVDDFFQTHDIQYKEREDEDI